MVLLYWKCLCIDKFKCLSCFPRGHCDRMVVGFTTTCTSSAYHL
jgi:hypothetical protein